MGGREGEGVGKLLMVMGLEGQAEPDTAGTNIQQDSRSFSRAAPTEAISRGCNHDRGNYASRGDMPRGGVCTGLG